MTMSKTDFLSKYFWLDDFFGIIINDKKKNILSKDRFDVGLLATLILEPCLPG